MMTYFKQINEHGELVLLLTYDFTPNITNQLIVEITQEEYEASLEELIAKAEAGTEQEEQEYLTEQGQKSQAYDILMGNEVTE